LKGYEITQTDHSLLKLPIPSNRIIKFTNAHELLMDRFSIEISKIKKKINLTTGNKVYFIDPILI
jgi:hypothetical protein